MADTKRGWEVEVRERKAGRKVLRYEVRSYPFECETYPGGVEIKTVMCTSLGAPPLGVFEVGAGKPKDARALAEAAAAKWREKYAAEGRVAA